MIAFTRCVRWKIQSVWSILGQTGTNLPAQGLSYFSECECWWPSQHLLFDNIWKAGCRGGALAFQVLLWIQGDSLLNIVLQSVFEIPSSCFISYSERTWNWKGWTGVLCKKPWTAWDDRLTASPGGTFIKIENMAQNRTLLSGLCRPEPPPIVPLHLIIGYQNRLPNCLFVGDNFER